ncbi:ABC transporter ATP-binding protein [Acetobacterium wieringae]|uniref:ABC transporter ATP-binding protein n=1 Tax=Acetobacterium wieringae TaxID=52694 RepID=UPI0020333DE9|nr:ABC transporter ATP-binding protein [Acetobacterium wieringae]URN84459.1 ATP-binding cassette domain-containing protein [Acetobacterium wieringae]
MNRILAVSNLKKTYTKGKTTICAVDEISFHVEKGECLALVGESGSGKSTVAKLITGLESLDGGEIVLDGKTLKNPKGKELKRLYHLVQMVFQMPVDSFNPRIRLGESVMEGLINQGMGRREAKNKAIDYLEICGLGPEFVSRYPSEVSGGECQRASIARALARQPQLLICDEATSALDVTVQSQIMALLTQLRKDQGMSQLMICHDLALVQQCCDRVLVMHQGRVVEAGTPDEVIANPREAYTKKLIDSIL